MRSSQALCRNASPMFEDWARHYGVEIEWVHGWEKDGKLRATAFGYHLGNTNDPRTMTIVVPRD